ncbi:AAA family ATPase [bacterium]|nr:AAA family ATPase [bacterium]
MSSRVAWLGGQGFGFEIESRVDADLARRIMEFAAVNQASRTKRCEKDALHISLSWHPDEKPTRPQMEAAARDALKALGMENARAVFAAHNDTDHAHLHIVASRINPETGRAFSDRDDFIKINAWALAYERQAGVIRCNRREAIDPHDHQKLLETLTYDRSTFSRRDLERLLAKSVISRAERNEFADRILARDEVIPLRESASDPVTRYTTRAVLAAERDVLRDAAARAKDTRHGVTDAVREHTLDRHAHLDAEQRAAFGQATDAKALAIIAGAAGTGKTATLTAIRDAYEDTGCRVIGLAWTNAVVQDLKRDGFTQAATIAAELKRLELGLATWDRRTVLVVDEAAMLATRHLQQLTMRADAAGAKLILAGDDRQLASIERGGLFGALRQEHGAAELHEVRRVADAEQQHAFRRMHGGDFRSAIEIFEKKGAVRWSSTQEEARADLVSRYTADAAAAPGKSRFVFAYTNADVAEINRDIRARRKELGELGRDHSLPTKAGAQMFAVGDRIQFTGTARHRSDRDKGLANGVVGTIRNINGSRVSIQLDGLKSGKPRFLSFEVGENTAPGQFNSFRHGYAGTIYKGQGRTLDQTYLFHSRHWRRASSYVALTRHRGTTNLFVARETARDRDELARQMARVDDRRSASQFLQDLSDARLEAARQGVRRSLLRRSGPTLER